MVASTIAQARPTGVRQRVLWLTVIVYMITYMDRICISHAAGEMRKEYGFDAVTLGWIFSAFNLSYSLLQIPGGWLGDKFGPRRVLTAIVLWWSAFTAATALAVGKFSMYAVRLLFGAGEAGAFPTATRALSLWLPASERGFAQGVTHSGARLGAALTPPLAVYLIAQFGWRSVFYIFGALGALWAVIWFWYYRDLPEQHGSVNEAELQVILEGGQTRKARARAQIPWRQIFRSGNLWLLCAMYFCYAYSLWIYLSWYPTYLQEARGFTLRQMGFWHMVPLIAATIGDTAGGWLSDHLARQKHSLRFARRSVAVIGFALAAAFIVPATLTADRYWSVTFTTAALFFLECTVGVSWAVAMDIGPAYAGSVSGVMNMCGNLGGLLASLAVGYMVQYLNWQVPFLAASGLCLLGALLFLRIDPSERILFDRTSSNRSAGAVTTG